MKEWSAMEILFVSVEGTRLLLALNYAQVHFFVYIWLNLRKIRMTSFEYQGSIEYYLSWLSWYKFVVPIQLKADLL